MTVSSAVAKAVYVTSLDVSQYAFPFKVFKERELSVSLVDSHFAVSPLSLGDDYTVSGLGRDEGGTVTLTDAGQAKAGEEQSLVLLRSMDFTQETDYRPYDVFPAETHERALDILTMTCQELREMVERAAVAPPNMDKALQDLHDFIQNRYLTLLFKGLWTPDTRYAMNDIVQGPAGDFWLVVDDYVSGSGIERDIAARNLIPYSGVLAGAENNVRWPWLAASDVKSGGLLTLPQPYLPLRDSFMLFYGGALCSPLKGGILNNQDSYHYEEIGTDRNVVSNQVRVWFNIKAGDELDMFVAASAFTQALEKALVAASGAEAAREEAEAIRENMELIRDETAAIREEAGRVVEAGKSDISITMVQAGNELARISEEGGALLGAATAAGLESISEAAARGVSSLNQTASEAQGRIQAAASQATGEINAAIAEGMEGAENIIVRAEQEMAGKLAAAQQASQSAGQSAREASSAAGGSADILAEMKASQGVATYLSPFNFGPAPDDWETNDDWQQAFTDWAFQNVPAWEESGEIPNATFVLNLYDEYEWNFRRELGTWGPYGPGAVGTAENGKLGVVKGTAGTAGAVSVNSDGSMFVNSWGDFAKATVARVQKIVSDLEANADYETPAYTVGSGGLRVFYNGAVCYPGPDAGICQYVEVGEAGASSSAIRFHFALAVNDVVMIEAA